MVITGYQRYPQIGSQQAVCVLNILNGNAGLVLQANDLRRYASGNEHIAHYFGFRNVPVFGQAAAGHNDRSVRLSPVAHSRINATLQIVRRRPVGIQTMSQNHNCIGFFQDNYLLTHRRTILLLGTLPISV